MWRDYKNRTERRRSSPAIPGWLWLSAGLALGLIVALVVYLVKLPPQLVPGSATTVQTLVGTPAATSTPLPKSTQPPPPSPATTDDRFRFFDELPNMRVEVPPEAPRPVHNPPAATSSTPPVPNAPPPKVNPDLPRHSASIPPPAKRGDAYVLQVGSYRNFREADGIKARLALMGLEASVQRVTVDRKETWYRVRVGPYASADDANRVREQLRRNKFKAIVLKLRG